MTVQGLESQGTTVQVGDVGSPETFVAIGRITQIGGPSGSAQEIDVTNLDSTAKNFIIGLPDEGNVNLTLNYDEDASTGAAQETLRAARAARAQKTFRIIMSDGTTTLEFLGFVSEFSFDIGVDGVVVITVSIRIDGTVSLLKI